MKRLKTMVFDSISEKELQIYKAVTALLEEGKNLSELTVSEIASKAGIGKGTTYEYFKSKDEIIGKTLLYEISTKMDEISKIVEAASGFKSRIYCIMDWLNENFTNQKSFIQLFELSHHGNGESKESLRTVMNKCPMSPDYFYEGLRELGMTGVEEGVLSG